MSNVHTRVLDAAELERIAKLEREASPSPWRECGADRGGCGCGLVWSIPLDNVVCEAVKYEDEEGRRQGRREDASFIANARTDVPALLDEVFAIRALVHAKPEETTLAAVERWQREFINRIDAACGVRR